MSSEAASLAPKQLPQMSTDQIRIGALTRFHLMIKSVFRPCRLLARNS